MHVSKDVARKTPAIFVMSLKSEINSETKKVEVAWSIRQDSTF